MPQEDVTAAVLPGPMFGLAKSQKGDANNCFTGLWNAKGTGLSESGVNYVAQIVVADIPESMQIQPTLRKAPHSTISE